MDFTLSEEQEAVAGLASRILGDKAGAEQLRALEAAGEWTAGDAWRELAQADLVGLCLPEAHGGGGFGFLEAALVLEQVGRHVAPVPYLPTVVAAMAVGLAGSPDQQAELLPKVARGDVVLAPAIVEPGDAVAPTVPATRAVAAGERWRLHGEKQFVAGGLEADRLLVPVDVGRGEVTVFLVDPAAEGVSRQRVVMTNLEPVAHVLLDGVEVGEGDRLAAGPSGADVAAWLRRHMLAGTCAVQAGVCAEALRLTAAYTSERRQFGSPIATFQAVAQRAADAYIDTEAVTLTARQAAWRLAEGLDAEEALAVAKFWTGEAAQRVVHAAQHLHGGIGVDVDYPLHRYFRWAKAGELALGGSTRHLLELGRRLATSPPS